MHRDVANHYRDLGGHRPAMTRAGYILAFGGILGGVTAALVYLSTLSTGGF